MTPFTGKQYLEIDIANSFGLDQDPWHVRLSWFQYNRSKIESDPMPDIVKWSKDAKEPAQFLAGVMAYRDTKAGKPTGYLCGLDATASGLQLLSVLSGCKQSAATCNLVDTGRREDAYTLVYQRVCEILDVHPSLFAIPRKDCKQALMTHLYGSKAVPKQVFGEDTPQLAAFYQAIDELMPGANELNHGLLGLWNPDALEHSWVLPDGFEAYIKVMDKDKHVVDFLGKKFEIIERVNRPKEQGLSLGANIIHSRWE